MAENKPIQPGDSVMLKSGKSPIMTVNSIVQGDAWCVWFEDKKMSKERFSLNALVIVNPEDYQ